MQTIITHLGLQDASEVNEITTSKIREVSVLLINTLSNRLKELEDALYKKDIEAMKNLQKDINKEELSYYGLLPIDKVLQAEEKIMNVSAEMQTVPWFKTVLKLFDALQSLKKHMNI